MTGTITTLARKFKFGATVLDDPAPHLAPEAALALFVPNYPFLASARLGEPVVEGDVLTYPVSKPEVQVKGAARIATAARPAAKRRTSAGRTRPPRPAAPRRRPVEDAIAALEAWGQEAAPVPAADSRWTAVSKRVEAILARPQAPMRDAFLIPLA